MYDQAELGLLNAGCTEEEVKEAKTKMIEGDPLFVSLVQMMIQAQNKGVPEKDIQLAWKLAVVIRKADE